MSERERNAGDTAALARAVAFAYTTVARLIESGDMAAARAGCDHASQAAQAIACELSPDPDGLRRTLDAINGVKP